MTTPEPRVPAERTSETSGVHAASPAAVDDLPSYTPPLPATVPIGYGPGLETAVVQTVSPAGNASPQPLVMTWTGPAEAGPSTLAPSLFAADAQADELPPDYAAARIPTDDVRYTFSPQGFNSMLLLPPADAQDTRPQYFVSVALNCFIPTSFVTTVRRGASEYGDYIGEFEMGLSEKRATVTMEGKQKLLTAVLKKDGSRFEGTFTWRFPYTNGKDILLQWRCQGPNLFCFARSVPPVGSPQRPLATLIGAPLTPSADDAPAPPTRLVISPAAHHRPLMDHVVVCALIIERRRLTPSREGRAMWS